MIKLIIKLLVSFVCFCPFMIGWASAVSVTLNVPAIKINHDVQIAKDNFTQQLERIAQSMNANVTDAIIGIAPLGGSKVSPFKELDLDGLVIVDWDRPGSPDKIQQAYDDPVLKTKLIDALQQSLNGGAMSTSTVMQVPVSAQILSRLWYELGVSTVRVQFYQANDAVLSLANQPYADWNGEPVSNHDKLLVTRFMFEYAHRSRELIYVSAKITSDNVKWRDALPVNMLQKLVPQGFRWSYLSADGLIFFSKKVDNGLNKGNQELLDLMTINGGVVLDYPQASTYNACLPSTIYDGIAAMCGRAQLEQWGFQLMKKWQESKSVFGYVGLTHEDEVRVYTRSENASINKNVNNHAIFSFTQLIQVGDDHVFNLIGDQS